MGQKVKLKKDRNSSKGYAIKKKTNGIKKKSGNNIGSKKVTRRKK